ncbi:MAG TPA: pentapeptide repeat-containing protein [Candidatus Saccharimonadales bacterium]|nr:pentapeptide repeat-containing protein [Candidatus Saccharimonadales bacterium]
MKISPPQMPAQLEDATLDELLDGDLEDVILADIDATNCLVSGLNISGVKFEKILLTAAQLERVSAKDLVAQQTDFSATHLANGAINRASFSNCRMTGVDFSKTNLHDVIFSGCKLDMANLRFADLRRVKFVDCTFAETDFLGAILYDVTFESCTLEKTVFDQAKCKQVDLRSSELIEISGWTSLKGATIDSVQLTIAAPYLANELGLTVRNT